MSTVDIPVVLADDFSGRGRRRQLATKKWWDNLKDTEEEYDPELSPMRRRDLVSSVKIPVGTIINIRLTHVTSPTSLKPADGSISYEVTTAAGHTVEAIDCKNDPNQPICA